MNNLKNSKDKKGNIEKGTNFYDRILRENAKEIFLPFIKQYLSFTIKTAEPITEKLTKTIERETDFLYKVTTTKNEKLLLHIEFQSSNDRQMIYRMAEYHGLIFKKFKLPIHHIVLYLGKEQVNMRYELEQNEIFTGFNLIAINELESETLLSSKIPEVVIMAFMGKYDKRKTKQILQRIIQRLKEQSKTERDLKKYVSQLLLLTRIQKLNLLTEKILVDMPLTIDIETDVLYKKGKEQGIELGKEQGIEQGIEFGIIALYKAGDSVERIALIFNLSVEKINTVLKKHKLL